jgi:hypothetical protein
LIRVATPLLLSLAVLIVYNPTPHVKATVPVGGSDPDVVTVAVKLTFCP